MQAFIFLVLPFVVSCAFVDRVVKPSVVKPPGHYCNIHKNHTLCKFQDNKINPDCGELLERGLTEEEKSRVVHLHNVKRAIIANGREKRGDPGPQPPAANMMELVNKNLGNK